MLPYMQKGTYCLMWQRCEPAKNLERRSLSWVIQVSPKCNHMHPYKREGEGYQTQRRRRDTQRGQHEDGGRGWRGVPTSQGKPGNTGSHQSWKRQGTDPPLETPEGALPCRQLDFSLLASRTGREEISVVSHQGRDNFLWQPPKTNVGLNAVSSLSHRTSTYSAVLASPYG